MKLKEGQYLRLWVEGKDFFDGDSKLATENIPADAVKKIEVLKNYNEVSQLRGLGNDQDNIALNIKLKEGKKNFWFGDVTAGAGFGEEFRYLANPKLFYYSPKGSINIIGNFNNTGDVPFTFRDYFNFTGGFRGFNQRGGTSFNVSDGGIGFLVRPNNQVNEIESNFAAANFSYTASKAWDISGFLLLNDSRTDFISNNLNTFINNEILRDENGDVLLDDAGQPQLSDTGVTQEFEEVSRQENQLALAKFSSVFKPNVNFQLDYDVLARLTGQDEESNGISRVLSVNGNTEDVVDEFRENTPFSINQNVTAYYTVNDKNIFAGTAQHLYQNEDPFYRALLSAQPFSNIIALDTVSDGGLFDVNQNRFITTNKLDAKIDYYYVLNKKSNLNFTLGTTLTRQDFDSNIFQILENGNRVDQTTTIPTQDGSTAALSNNTRFNFSDLFLGVHYKVKLGKFTLTPGLTLHDYTVATEQQGSRNTIDQVLLLPDFLGILQLKQSESIRFNYQLTAQYTDVTNYAEGLIFNNFNALSQGNRFLENALLHNININYFSFSSFNFTNWVAGVTYTSRVDPIKTVGNFSGISQVSQPVNNTAVPDQTLSGNVRFSKTWRKLKWNIRGNVSFSDLNNIINGETRNTQNFTQNYNTSVESNFKKGLNFELGFDRQITSSDNGGTDRAFTTDRPFANIQWRFLKAFNFEADWSFFNFDDDDPSTDISNTYQSLESRLYYQKPESKWEFSVRATNLLDIDVISNSTVNDISISNTEFVVQPRIVLLSVQYSL